MRFVLDTNLLVSAVIADGVPSHLLDAARARGLINGLLCSVSRHWRS